MGPYFLSYGLTLIFFVILDAIWLGSTSALLYRPVLGDMLLDKLRILPVIAFYLLYPAGLFIFAVLPAIKAGAFWPALIYGALFGLVAYATYDLTNFATLRNWTWQITFIDLAWGAFASAMASILAFAATRSLTSISGLMS